MVSLSNDGVSGVQSLENGYRSKYKPRKVSARRDFPPGCGSYAVPMSLKPEANGSTGAIILEANDTNQSKIVSGSVANGVGNPKIANGSVASDVQNPEMANDSVANGVGISETTNNMEAKHGVGAAGTQQELSAIVKSALGNFSGSGCPKIHGSSHETNSKSGDGDLLLDELVKKLMKSTDDVEKSIMEIQQTKKVNCLDTVDNTIEVERGESPETLVGQVNVTATDALLNDVEFTGLGLVGNSILHKSDSFHAVTGAVQVAKPVVHVGATVDSVMLPDHSESAHSLSGSIKPESSTAPKDKYRRRRVSAVRDFPPHCGCNVPLPTEEKELNASIDDYHKTKKVDTEPKTSMVGNGSDGLPSVEMLPSCPEESLNGVDKAPINGETRETLNDDAKRGSMEGILAGTTPKIAFDGTSEPTVEVAPMDLDKCDRDLQDGILEKTELLQLVPLSGTITETVGKTTEDSGRSVKKDIVNENVRPSYPDSGSRKELHAEDVHGLIAAPHWSGRKRKASSSSSDGGKREGHLGKSLQQKSKSVALIGDLRGDSGQSKKASLTISSDADGRSDVLAFMDEEKYGAYDEIPPEIAPISSYKSVFDSADQASSETKGKEIVVYSPGKSDDLLPSHCVFSSVDEVVVHGLMASRNCPWTKGKAVSKDSNTGRSGGKTKKDNPSWRKNAKAVAKKSSPKVKFSVGSSLKKQSPNRRNTYGSPGLSTHMNEEAYDHDENSPGSPKPQDFSVNPPPFGPSNPHHGDARNRVRETLRLFHTICRKILQKEEAKPDEERSIESAKKMHRIDLDAAKLIKRQGKEVNTETQRLGQVPGVEVGDEFQYRVELAVIGVHRLYQAGIDSMTHNGEKVACSIVASGAYDDDTELADVLIYSGQGGNIIGKSKKPEDQKMEKGNLALKNSIAAETPVRVVRGWKQKLVDPLDSKPKTITVYVYDGLYMVTEYWAEKQEPRGNLVFKFKLVRNPGQPELAWKELKKTAKSKIRPGVCCVDISGGKESLPICAVNTLDDEKPPSFNYISKMMYPNWYHPKALEGCDCIGRCSDSKKCRCAVRNGGEIPYNRNGAIVEAKNLVYECGPWCKCPPSCYNRVTQRGIKFKLEIFKTNSRGWGVRSLTSIPSGSFICEYAGELLEDKEAEQRVGNDEYLFDIGHNYSDSSLRPDKKEIPFEENEEAGGYTIDAAQYGNIGRFINHSCSPNLYAQNVIYDHDDKKMPHVMLFAAENIPPLQELTYHYNYTLDQVRDSDGNIKIKKCYCGTAECIGRMY